MKNFIPVMRAKRLIEMKEYTDKEYSIQDRKHYMMLEKNIGALWGTDI